MWVWAGSFSAGRCRRSLKLLTGVLCLAALPHPLAARVFMKQEEALSRAFPAPARVERKTLFLDQGRAAKIERESRERLPGRIVTYYVGIGKEGTLGYAYFDSHRVRTLPETIMVLVTPKGTVSRVSILSFSEPEDYLPREAWLDQFAGRGLDSDLAMRRGIHNLTGASLSAVAITSACRRILAIHRVVREEER